MKKPSQTRKNKKSSSKKITKNVPWRGWKDVKPTSHGRTVMEEKCGKKCFLGPYKSFPICDMNTCKVDKKGVWSAYIRAKEWATRSKTLKKKHASYHVRHPYSKIARTAKRMLYKNKGGGLFGFFESKNPLIKLHKSQTPFEERKYEADVLNYLNSILLVDVTEDKGRDYVYEVSGYVKEYFNTYKISTGECKSDDNKKILTTLNVIQRKFLSILNEKPENEKSENEKPDVKIIILSVFKANINILLQNLNIEMIKYGKECRNQNNEDEERPRRNSDPQTSVQQPKRSTIFGKTEDRPRERVYTF